jgi:hypothetical protein
MNDEFDVDLRARLDALSAAAPVDAQGSTMTVSGRVRPGRAGQRLALGGLVPLVAIVVVGGVAAGLLKLGPFGPAATGSVDGPVVATATDALFELTIRSAKAQYAASEPIEIDASLVYRSEGEITIGHAQGASVPGRGNVDGPDTGGTGGPLGFGILEPVIGDLVLFPAWAESCERTTLVSGAPLTVPFQKSAAWSGGDPRSDEYREFALDPVLRLEAGTWHAFAVAEFAEGNCGGPKHQIRVEIEIEVARASEPTDAQPTDAPIPTGGTPDPSVGPEASRGQVQADGTLLDVVEDGDFMLRLRAAEAVYRTYEPIDVVAELTYIGADPKVVLSGGVVLGFGIRQLDGELAMDPLWPLPCGPLGTLSPGGRPLVIPFAKSGGYGADDPNRDFWVAYFEDPELRLPEGSWEIYAIPAFRVGPGCELDGPELRASVTIEVVP